jgi:hypothetical protein
MLSSGAGPPQVLDLSGWIALQAGETITRPWLDFTAGGRRFRLAVDRVEIQPRATEPPALSTFEGTLAVSAPTPTP